MAHHEIVMAGFGGQGIMSAGSLVAYAGMMNDKHVSWFPMYGPEKRGGTAACHVIVSDEPVGSPIVNNPDVLIIMNRPSLDKYEDIVKEGGIIISDSSITDRRSSRRDVDIYEIPATKMSSEEMGNSVFANVILLGKLLELTNIIPKDVVMEAIKHVLPEKKHYMIPDEIKALELGMNF